MCEFLTRLLDPSPIMPDAAQQSKAAVFARKNKRPA
jgi:hypothetical protein